MKKTSVLLTGLLLFFVSIASAATVPPQAKVPKFPSVEEQLKAAHAKPGSALEKLIRANQEFGRLKARDAGDQVVPPWLKVYWQKGHPQGNYDNPDDPTGGYPHVLKEILEWMVSHQDLKPGNPEATMPPGREFRDRDDESIEHHSLKVATTAATAGTNVRTSGAQTSSRSESDIRVNYWDPSKIIAGSNNISGSGQQGMYYSSDGGVTWGQTYLPLTGTDSFHSDPTVDWTSDGTAWSTTMGINGNVLKVQSYRSTNGGATWVFDGTVSGSQTQTDKQMQWIDHSATSAYKDQNYVIWHNGAPAYMNRRTSSGWGTPIKVSGTETTGTAIGADVKTNSTGDVFGFWPDTGSRGIYMVKSTNGGASYAAPVRIVTTYDSYDIGVPAFNNRRILIYVSGGTYRTGTTNNVYALWADLSGNTGCTTASNEPGASTSSTCKTRIWFSRSTDGGATWSARVKINDQSGLNDQFNPFIAVDETNGNLGAIYYDTVGDPGRKKVDVYYQLSTNGGVSWEAPVKVTTAMTDETVSGADSGNQFGDYNSLSGYGNAFFPSWTDRRNNAKEEIWTAKITASSTPTYSISGSAGTSGATVTAGTASATSDASSAYTVSGLAAGTYTVTPSKSGCTFSPASSSVTITASNVTGVNFTATCTAPTFSISGNAGTSGATVAAGASSTTSDASGNYSMSGFAAGTYTVTPSKSGCTFSPASSSVTITSANVTANFTATCGSGDIQLTSGVAVTGQNVAQGAWKYYFISVPAGATNLTFATTAATGDVDIYTQHNAKPTLSAYICRPYTASGNETCSASNPASGTWWVGVYGYAAGGYTITGTVTTPVATYSISGSAGTPGATVTAGSQGATSDASNNYTIGGLANGTYTVTPSKSGCTFSPASTSVTISGANVTGTNFTATCSSSSTLFSNGFDSSTGWAVVDLSGTAGNWTFVTSGTLPTTAPHGGTGMAKFNSYDAASGSQTRVYRTTGFAIPGTAATATLKFWMYHDTGYSTYLDKVQVQVSTGTTWTNVGAAVNRYDGSTGWKQHTIDLTAYKGTTVQLGFVGISAYGNNEYIDDVTVTTP
ncbi:MAG TPA: pre-peptidase C-terminal domain-containing protein [Thermoanaerobaculia bacterium]|nr:pre-peptidase C-terminal domain-containing protein [Thermoanaerobaculia bacterium]